MWYSRINFAGVLRDLIRGLPTLLLRPREYLREIRHLLRLTSSPDILKHRMIERQVLPVVPRYGAAIAANFRDYRRVSEFFAQPAFPVLQEIDASNILIRFKILRPYLRSGLSTRERTDRLIAHYRMSLDLFHPTLVRDLHTRGARIAHVELTDRKDRLSLHLQRRMRTWLDGELSLDLRDAAGRQLYLMTFNFDDDGDQKMFIGSAIGVAALDRIRQLTKDMHGLRPHALLLFVAQSLCKHLSINVLQAVSNRGQVWNETGNPDRVRFDYDAFWKEHGGCESNDPMLFQLPVTAIRRSTGEIESRKRAQYRRRYALMDQVESDLTAWLSSPSVTRSKSVGATP